MPSRSRVRRASFVLLVSAFAPCLWTSGAHASDPADEEGESLAEQPADPPEAPSFLPPPLAPALDPRSAPDANLDPRADERALDPVDDTQAPSGDAIEHDPFLTGESAPPPFATSVDCPPGTIERRARHRDGAAELWCADVRGRRHGPFVRIHPSGSPALSGTYRDGRRHGLFLEWFPTGRLEGRSTFVHGLEHGVEERFYESGRPRAQTSFHEGKKHGLHRAWHESGRLAAEGSYMHDEPAPGFARYDEEGRVIDDAALAGGATLDESAARVGQGPPLSARLIAASAGGVGATAGLVVGVPAAFALAELGAFDVVDPNGWLPYLLIPPLLTAAGAVLGTLLFTRFPGPAMAGIGAALGIPLGAAVGGLVGGALAGTFALVVLAAGASQEAALGLLSTGAMGGAVAGAVVGPPALGAMAAWLYADGPRSE